MKPLLTIFFLALIAAGNAQVLNADSLLKNIACRLDTNCLHRYIISNGYKKETRKPGDIRFGTKYKSVKPLCTEQPDSLAFGTINLLMMPDGNSLSLTTFCEDIYYKLLKDFKARHFKLKKHSKAARALIRYKSKAYPYLHLLAEVKNDNTGKTTYIITLETLMR